jgi:hypothetical protein
MNIHEQIAKAFGNTNPPLSIVGSYEGEEPIKLENEFKARPRWDELEAAFIDKAPDGFATALSFFSDEAFAYYIPAFLLADLTNKLEYTDVVFHLTYGLDDASRGEKINPKRYGEKNWYDAKRCQFSIFSREQIACIIDYLNLKLQDENHEFDFMNISEALINYWNPRYEELENA